MIDRGLIAFATERYQRSGYEVVPLRAGLKIPQFKASRQPTPETLPDLIRQFGFNIALRLKNFMAVDTDGPSGEEFVRDHKLTSPMVNIASRGRHLLFRTEIEFTNLIHPLIAGVRAEVDFLCHGIIVAPPSVVTKTEHQYRWQSGIVRPEELPFFPTDLLKEVIAQNKGPPPPKVDPLPFTDDAKLIGMRKWISRVESVAHNSGDKAAFRVAVKIVSVVKDFDAAMAEIRAWNSTNARPPWSEKELEHKIRCALKYAQGG